MNKYTQLDAAIEHAIDNQESQFAGIFEMVRPHACWVAQSAGCFRSPMRCVDARLQALRKAGRIKFRKGHWVTTLTRTSEHQQKESGDV